MQTTLNCEHYEQNNNLNLTCQKYNQRCILLSGNNYCQDFYNKHIAEMIRLSERMGLYK